MAALPARSLCRLAVAIASTLLLVAVPYRGARAQTLSCGDLDGSGQISASDALLLLRRAVGQDVTLQCPACQSSTTSTITGPTTTIPIGTTTTMGTCSFPGSSCGVNADCCQNEGSTLCCDGSCLFEQACKQTAAPCLCDAQCCSGICGSSFAGLCD